MKETVILGGGPVSQNWVHAFGVCAEFKARHALEHLHHASDVASPHLQPARLLLVWKMQLIVVPHISLEPGSERRISRPHHVVRKLVKHVLERLGVVDDR